MKTIRRLLTAAAVALLSMGNGARPPHVAAHVNPAVTIDVDAALNQHPIDPRIYGASWATAAEITDMGLTLSRWGGNAMSRYNWIYSTANRCKDYYFYNIPDDVSSGDGSNGKSADDFIGATFGAGAEPVMTIPMLSLLPKDRSKSCSFSFAKYGVANEAYAPEGGGDCGNGRYPDGDAQEGNGPRILNTNDPLDTSAVYPISHQGDWVQHLIDTWGSASAGGVRYYSLDNEPSLWSADHWDVHPAGASYDEVWGKMEELGAAIRAKDPDAVITGPEEWGWSGYFMSGLDQENYGTPQAGADRAAHDDTAYIDWLVDQAANYEAVHGTRILDVITVHFYPQNGEFSNDVSATMQGFRNRSTRALWDPDYVDESWIGGTEVGGARVRLVPRLRDWAARYPGTQIGLTEYNWGGDNHINGATTQADILGILGREDIDMAVRWGTPSAGSFTRNAFRMYRNYDDAAGKFGDVSVSAGGTNPDEVSVFAARRTSDDALTVMIINKIAGSTPATVNLANFSPEAGAAAQRWQLDATNTITQLGDVALAGSSLSLTLPEKSVTLLIVPGANALDAPANVVATATSSSAVTVTWDAVAGAAGYEVHRSTNHPGGYALLDTTAATTIDDLALDEGTTYLYQVRALPDGPFSSIDAATTIVFTDDPLPSGTPIRATHVTQLRTAVSAMRAAAGLDAPAFTDPALVAGHTIRGVHLTQLRTALDEARGVIGLVALAYTDPAITTATKVKAAHVTELRDGVK